MKKRLAVFVFTFVVLSILWGETTIQNALSEATHHALDCISAPVSARANNATFFPKQDDIDYCTEHNFLPHPQAAIFERDKNTSRIFSIRASDFVPHHASTCSSVEDAVNAIRYGSRQWDPQYQHLSLLERESIPSTFIPYECDLPVHSPKQMCQVLNRFSHVIIQGDSLSRHVQGGLLMGLRNDLIRGSLVQTVPSPYYKCRCDAQFSANKLCREHAPLYNRFQPWQLGLCSELNVEDQFESVFNINRLHKGVYKFDGVNCTTSQKPILVIAQGGVHLKYNAGQTYNRILKQFLRDPIFQSCAKQGNAFLIWTSYHAQSDSYHEKYPDQSLGVGISFNEQMKSLIQTDKIRNLTIMDWLNFTTGAQHSDGLHYAAQVNYFKAHI